MKNFIYDGNVKIIYGADQMETVAKETAVLGKRVLVVPTGSFIKGGHYEELENAIVGKLN